MSDEMTIEEAAAFLGVTPQTLHRHARKERIQKHYHIVGSGTGGRRVFFLRADVEALRDAEAPAPTPAPVPPITKGKRKAKKGKG